MTGRIWIAANQGEVGGGEVMLRHLAAALRELDRDVAVVAPEDPGEVADLVAADGVDVVRAGGPGRAGYARALRAWDRGRSAGDAVWCNGLLPAAALAGRPRRVVHLHQVPERPHLRLASTVARTGALAVLAPSRFAADRIRGARVLPNWVDGPTALPQGPARPDGAPLTVGYLGRLSQDKGVLTLLEAAELLRGSDPGGFSFRVAGESRFVPAPEAARVASALAAAGDDVVAPGWQETAGFLRSVDVLAVPSLAPESFGLVAAEAMAAGVPVVVSDAGALPEVVGGAHPLVTPRGDAAALAAALRRVRDADPAETVRAQRERWAAVFSPGAGRAALADLLHDLHL